MGRLIECIWDEKLLVSETQIFRELFNWIIEVTNWIKELTYSIRELSNSIKEISNSNRELSIYE